MPWPRRRSATCDGSATLRRTTCAFRLAVVKLGVMLKPPCTSNNPPWNWSRKPPSSKKQSLGGTAGSSPYLGLLNQGPGRLPHPAQSHGLRGALRPCPALECGDAVGVYFVRPPAAG